MCPLTFVYGIQCSTTFIWGVFSYNAYFWQHRALKRIYFPIFVHYNISSPSSTPGADKHMHPQTF